MVDEATIVKRAATAVRDPTSKTLPTDDKPGDHQRPLHAFFAERINERRRNALRGAGIGINLPASRQNRIMARSAQSANSVFVWSAGVLRAHPSANPHGGNQNKGDKAVNFKANH